MESEKLSSVQVAAAPHFCAGDLLLGLGGCGIVTDLALLNPDTMGVDTSVWNLRIPELGCTIGDELNKPVRLFEKAMVSLQKSGMHLKGSVRITEGLCKNVASMMPSGLTARIETDSFPIPPLFDMIARYSKIPRQEMYEHFNMGIGMVIAIAREEVGQAKNILCCCGERAYIIGSVIRGRDNIELI